MQKSASVCWTHYPPYCFSSVCLVFTFNACTTILPRPHLSLPVSFRYFIMSAYLHLCFRAASITILGLQAPSFLPCCVNNIETLLLESILFYIHCSTECAGGHSAKETFEAVTVAQMPTILALTDAETSYCSTRPTFSYAGTVQVYANLPSAPSVSSSASKALSSSSTHVSVTPSDTFTVTGVF